MVLRTIRVFTPEDSSPILVCIVQWLSAAIAGVHVVGHDHSANRRLSLSFIASRSRVSATTDVRARSSRGFQEKRGQHEEHRDGETAGQKIHGHWGSGCRNAARQGQEGNMLHRETEKYACCSNHPGR